MGKITDPRNLEMDYPSIKIPEKFYLDDSMIIPPQKKPEKIEVYRGPNIGDPPSNPPFPEDILGFITIKVGDKITTDHIIPAGSRMKYRSNVPKYSEFVFEIVDDSFFSRASKIRDDGKHNVIVGGQSYGQGSSREHAALCPMYLGVKAVLAKSFERIHTANLINFGIIPLTFQDDNDYNTLETGDEIKINNARDYLMNNEPFPVKNITKGTEFQATYSLSERQRKILLEGGLLPYTKNLSKK
jgi:aconitate hydratase